MPSMSSQKQPSFEMLGDEEALVSFGDVETSTEHHVQNMYDYSMICTLDQPVEHTALPLVGQMDARYLSEASDGTIAPAVPDFSAHEEFFERYGASRTATQNTESHFDLLGGRMYASSSMYAEASRQMESPMPVLLAQYQARTVNADTQPLWRPSAYATALPQQLPATGLHDVRAIQTKDVDVPPTPPAQQYEAQHYEFHNTVPTQNTDYYSSSGIPAQSTMAPQWMDEACPLGYNNVCLACKLHRRVCKFPESDGDFHNRGPCLPCIENNPPWGCLPLRTGEAKIVLKLWKDVKDSDGKIKAINEYLRLTRGYGLRS
ncbi:hypothetical protein CERSUDRAFT_126771 [Gelatoporia subvermispora B]|uniref:Uncharacterized protein n=1 Tax=Ceriporiopsis subvermispora (strain B) TaxID=914234 RepID=M2QJQ3_CERS8|nr:hypothetical protein CERSUDRAFT_126771 [Gelatoporia subvermispora B]